MATIQARQKKDGSYSYRVLARIGKKLDGETFSGPDAATAAADFKRLAERIGMEAAKAVRDQRSGRTAEQQQVPTVAAWVRHHIDELTGITDGTRDEYYRILRKHIEPMEIGALPVDVATRSHVKKWVRDQERGEPATDRKGSPVMGDDGKPVIKKPAAKSIQNRHGLLSAAFELAAEDDDIRTDNPCKGTQIAETEQREMVFLTPDEFALLLSYVPERWRDIPLALVSTGARYSEITALPVYAVHTNHRPPDIRIERSWKWISNSRAVLGPPKTKKGRRTVYLGTQAADMLVRAIAGKELDDLVFATASGKRITRSNFHDLAWQPAIAAATSSLEPDGTEKLPERILRKRPRVHDLRHTYASWQIAAGTPLNVIRDQMGHKSITTTVDLYGHLMPDAGRAAAAAMSDSLSLAIPRTPSAIGPGEGDVVEGELVDDELALDEQT